MYPILFSFGSINVYSHGVMMALGAVVGAWFFLYLVKNEKVPKDYLLAMTIWTIIGGVIGARILYLLLYFDQFDSLQSMLAFWNGGLVSFGGMIGALIVTIIFVKNMKQSILKWLDLVTPGLLLGWSVGRIGCYLNGDSFGVVTSNFGFWQNYPTPLFESACLLIIGLICLFLVLNKYKKIPDGLVFSLGTGLYGLCRFGIDYFKAEPVWFWSLKYGQIGSLVTTLLAVILMLFIVINKYKPLSKIGSKEEKC